MTNINNWASLIKLSHTLFSLPFAFIGFFLAFLEFPEKATVMTFALMIFAVFFARNAAMAFNRYADRDIDKKNERTKEREIPSKKISAEKAMIFVLLNILLFIITAYLINPLAFYLSPIAIVVILGYSYSKRVTWLCHYILGLGLAIAPIGAYIVLAEKFTIAPLILSAAVFFWVGGFDILYALQDESFDKTHKLHSIPARFGRKLSLIISAVSHLFTVAILALFGTLIPATWIFWTGFVLFSGILTWEHLIVKPNDISRINFAFATMNATGSLLFAAFTILDLFSAYL
jgi:4-hydroxybenzoate polyprenyltransferase